MKNNNLKFIAKTIGGLYLFVIILGLSLTAKDGAEVLTDEKITTTEKLTFLGKGTFNRLKRSVSSLVDYSMSFLEGEKKKEIVAKNQIEGFNEQLKSEDELLPGEEEGDKKRQFKNVKDKGKGPNEKLANSDPKNQEKGKSEEDLDDNKLTDSDQKDSDENDPNSEKDPLDIGNGLPEPEAGGGEPIIAEPGKKETGPGVFSCQVASAPGSGSYFNPIDPQYTVDCYGAEVDRVLHCVGVYERGSCQCPGEFTELTPLQLSFARLPGVIQCTAVMPVLDNGKSTVPVEFAYNVSTTVAPSTSFISNVQRFQTHQWLNFDFAEVYMVDRFLVGMEPMSHSALLDRVVKDYSSDLIGGMLHAASNEFYYLGLRTSIANKNIIYQYDAATGGIAGKEFYLSDFDTFNVTNFHSSTVPAQGSFTGSVTPIGNFGTLLNRGMETQTGGDTYISSGFYNIIHNH